MCWFGMNRLGGYTKRLITSSVLAPLPGQHLRFRTTGPRYFPPRGERQLARSVVVRTLCLAVAAACVASFAAACSGPQRPASSQCGPVGTERLVRRSAPERPAWITVAKESEGGFSWWTGRRSAAAALDGGVTDARLDAFRQVVEHMGLSVSVSHRDQRKDSNHEIDDLLVVLAEAKGSGWKERESYWEVFESCDDGGGVEYVHNVWMLVSVDEAQLKHFIEQERRKLTVTAALNVFSFTDGQAVTVRVSASREAYIYVIMENWAGETSLLFPNAYSSDNLVAPGRPGRIPDEKMEDAGVLFAASLPPDRTEVVEKVYILASCTPLSGRAPDQLMREFVSCLDSSRVHCCARKVLKYQIVEKQ